MIVEFDTLPSSSKVWIFQSDRILNTIEKKTISSNLNQFLDSWVSHGSELCVSFTIKYDVFLIIGVDSEYLNASGCSIDKLMARIAAIGNAHSIDFFNRLNICILDGDAIQMISLNSLMELIKIGKVDADTQIFHNNISTKFQLDSEWKKKVQDSWLRKYLPVNV